MVPAKSRARLPQRLLSSLPATELAQTLEAAGGSATQARATAAKVVRYVFGRPGGDAGTLAPAWDDAALSALGVGAWALESLLTLSPEVSLTLLERAPAEDGSERLVLATKDDQLLETVIIPGPARTTICVSSQVGCARACTFCETGALGLVRQLSAGEIVDQVRVARSLWGSKHPPVQNVVFMGMGEPLDNLSEVARATHVLTDDRGMKLSPSRVTVSTVGVADKLQTFFETCRAELAVSLNASSDEQRSRIMPINQRFNLEELFAALERHLPRGHKVLFEYVLIAGENDSDEDADRVAAWARRVPSRVNVIPLNPLGVARESQLRAPSRERLSAFVARLAGHGITTLVRVPRGRQVGGACGQLAGARRSLGVSPAIG